MLLISILTYFYRVLVELLVAEKLFYVWKIKKALSGFGVVVLSSKFVQIKVVVGIVLISFLSKLVLWMSYYRFYTETCKFVLSDVLLGSLFICCRCYQDIVIIVDSEFSKKLNLGLLPVWCFSIYTIVISPKLVLLEMLLQDNIYLVLFFSLFYTDPLRVLRNAKILKTFHFEFQNLFTHSCCNQNNFLNV